MACRLGYPKHLLHDRRSPNHCHQLSTSVIPKMALSGEARCPFFLSSTRSVGFCMTWHASQLLS